MATDPQSAETRAVAAAQEALDSGDAGAVERALAALDALPVEDVDPYVRGRLLAALGRRAEARQEYDRALTRDPGDARAHYSLGLLAAEDNDQAEATRQWEAAVAADPGHVDALYNLGQVAYNTGQFERALECWQAARRHVPTDLDILKKVLQTQHALGRDTDADQTWQWLVDAWKSSPDPRTRALQEVVVDQFKAAGRSVMAFRPFAPPAQGLGHVLTFRVFSDPNTVVALVQVETSDYLREAGTPYVLGLTTSAGHRTIGPTFASLPPYSELRGLAVRAIEQFVQ